MSDVTAACLDAAVVVADTAVDVVAVTDETEVLLMAAVPPGRFSWSPD